jgi:hypothetical protein
MHENEYKMIIKKLREYNLSETEEFLLYLIDGLDDKVKELERNKADREIFYGQ